MRSDGKNCNQKAIINSGSSNRSSIALNLLVGQALKGAHQRIHNTLTRIHALGEGQKVAWIQGGGLRIAKHIVQPRIGAGGTDGNCRNSIVIGQSTKIKLKA